MPKENSPKPLSMEDGEAILKILFVQNFVLQHNDKKWYSRERICEYDLKNNSIYCGLLFIWQILHVGLIEEHLD